MTDFEDENEWQSGFKDLERTAFWQGSKNAFSRVISERIDDLSLEDIVIDKNIFFQKLLLVPGYFTKRVDGLICGYYITNKDKKINSKRLTKVLASSAKLLDYEVIRYCRLWMSLL